MSKKSFVNTSMIDVLSAVIIRKVKRGKRGMQISMKQDGTIILSLPSFVPISVGKKFLLAKKDWILETKKRIDQLPRPLLLQGSRKEYELHKEAARECIIKRVEYFQAFYKVTYRRLAIRNQKTRFGSCSSRGNLSFTYQLLFLPDRLRDYVIVHELCHLKELNHSRKFWALVALTIPDYQDRKRELQAFSRSRS
jgi:predicted metal-dependent hydrolase